MVKLTGRCVDAGIAAETPRVDELLGEKETVIDPYYMQQLLQYGISLGQQNTSDIDAAGILEEAEVR